MSKIEKEKKKVPYKLMNWSEYNKALENRGSLTIWISDEVLEGWYADCPPTPGGQYRYSDLCIESLISLKSVLNLPYRQTVGFAKSLLSLMNLSLRVPSYSQLSRREGDLEIEMEVPKPSGKLHIVVDSTGLKVYGEGEWKVRQHGYTKRRTWRKLHLAVDPDTNFIHACELTENDVDDASQVEGLLDAVAAPVDKFSGDGAYDKSKVWDIMEERGIEGVIPPRKDANYWTDKEGELLEHQRNRILEWIDLFGRKWWKENFNYHKRSISETAMFRFKNIFGAELFSRKFEKQIVEAKLKSKIINEFTALGMPVSIAWD